MIKLKRILCPTDLSTESDEALRYAVALAYAYEAELILLHCSQVDASDESSSSTDWGVSRLFTESLAPHIVATRQGSLNWRGVIIQEFSDVGQAIVAEADKQDVDLIVMRSRRRPRAAILLGSTAETVSRSASCPVLVTHPQEREWIGRSGDIDLRRILIACDFSPDSQLALNYGLSLAQEYQGEVHVLHVLAKTGDDEPELAWSNSTESSAYKFVAQKIQQSIPKEVFLWCKVVNVVRSGKTHNEVIAYARENEIDLICMGASGGDWSLSRAFGSNVDRVLREAPCPVLIARPVAVTGAKASA